MFNKVYAFFLSLICLTFTACVKDTNFEQADNVLLTPIVELDLVYFNLRATDFYDSIASNEILTVRDTTQIKFLDDSTLQESLKQAEFYFKFTNSIPRDFQVDFQFLTEANDITYAVGTSVNKGTVETPVLTEFLHNIEGENVVKLTKANKVVVMVTIPSSNENLQGSLNLKSKTTYFFEYQ